MRRGQKRTPNANEQLGVTQPPMIADELRRQADQLYQSSH
jgi:hypothetical protein